MLNLEDLHSNSTSEHPTHVTISITPTQSQLSQEPPTGPATGQQVQTGSENAPQCNVEGGGSGDQPKDLSLSDLASGVYSPGAVLPLSSGNLSATTRNGNIQQAAVNEKPIKGVSSFQMESYFSQVKHTGQYRDMPLLQLDTTSGAPARQRRGNHDLQQEYPHLTATLRQFGSAVAPVKHPTLHSGCATGAERREKFAEVTAAIPLLMIPKLCGSSSAANRDHVLPPSAMRTPHPVQAFPSHQNQQPPLLHPPTEGDTLPGMVPVVMPQKNQSNTPMPQQRMTAKASDLLQPFPLLTLPPHPPPPSHPHLLHTAPPPPDYTLPQVPIRPFVPRLIPPHLLQNQQQSSLPLLRLDDPLTKMREAGLKLLQLPKTKSERPPKLLQLQEDHPACRPFKCTPFHPPSLGEPPGPSPFLPASLGEPREPWPGRVFTSAQNVTPKVADIPTMSEGAGDSLAVVTQEPKQKTQTTIAR